MGYDSSPIDRPTLHWSIVPGVVSGVRGIVGRMQVMGLSVHRDQVLGIPGYWFRLRAFRLRGTVVEHVMSLSGYRRLWAFCGILAEKVTGLSEYRGRVGHGAFAGYAPFGVLWSGSGEFRVPVQVMGFSVGGYRGRAG